MPERLTMTEFLTAVKYHKTTAREVLVGAGHHPNVVYAKAEKAARKGYTEYGVVADRPWLTSAGEAFLTNRESPTQ
jgi:hypothetical protein